MKHTLPVTIVLLAFFVVSQVFGLWLINADIKVATVDNVTVVEHPETAVGPRPDLEPRQSFFTVIVAIAIGTLLALALLKYKILLLWKTWYFLAVFIAISVALGVLIPKAYALGIAILLAALKLWKPNFYTHNLTELLIYPGIALLFVPLLNVFWMVLLLLVISAYDAYAVWKSKHMIKLAKFQSKAHTFAGLAIPYKKIPEGEPKRRTAILGGGDIAFPLLFSGVVMESLILAGTGKTEALLRALLITVFVTVALAFLFFKGKQDKFYPAMPFITLGCLLGYALAVQTS